MGYTMCVVVLSELIFVCMLVCNIWNSFLHSNKNKICFIQIQANSLLRELLVKQTWDTPDSFD